MAEKEKYIGEAKMREKPKKALKFLIGEKAIKTKHLDDACVTTSKIQDKAVTPEKLSDGVQGAIISPITESLDQKYKNITDELYSMIASLQVGGIALSQQFGDRTDIGISQKTLTKALGRFWQEMETITGKDYMNFSLSVVPSVVFSEAPATITIKADCSDAISNFDSIKVYVDNVLIGESSDTEVYTKAHTISETSQVKAVGVILGKTITKTVTAIKEIPFFMGSGQRYEDVMNMECHKELHGSLEGDYDIVVNNTNDYIFIIIPISHREEFRRAKLDMNGFEIPLEVTEKPDYIICQTLNRYQAGEYNIDIDINS